jgi:hypothetical protein
MFSSKRGLAWRSLAVTAAALVGMGVFAGVQALASGGAPTLNPPKTAQQVLAQLRVQMAAHAGPRVAARLASGAATTVTCGESITASVTLDGDLNCEGTTGGGLDIVNGGVTLDLNGFSVFGAAGSQGIGLDNVKDTVENGTVVGFGIEIAVNGLLPPSRSQSVTANALQPSEQDVVKSTTVSGGSIGIDVGAAGSTVAGNVAADNTVYGIEAFSPGGIVDDNHVLNNGEGMFVEGGSMKVSGNVADGNTGAGIAAANTVDGGTTVSSNVADFNGGLGIFADVSGGSMDGGKNLATGNTNPQQCSGLVCTPHG